jgi:hypothetical protein
MSRETRINRTIRRALERQVQKIEATKPPRRNKVLKLLAFVIGIPGVLAALLALLPRVAVTASDPTDPVNPFSSSFMIANTGYIPLPNTTVSVCIRDIMTEGAPKPNVTPDYTKWPCFQNAKWTSHYMALDDKFTVTISDFIVIAPSASLREAYLLWKVSYDWPLIHWRREKIFPISAYKQTNGRFYWYADTLPN